MPLISLVGQSQAGGLITGPGAPHWTAEGLPMSLLGDGVMSHAPGIHQGPAMVMATSWMSIEGIPVVIQGCAASCGHTADGNPWFDLPM